MEQCNKSTILFWIKKINEYLRNSNFQIDPLPKITLVGDDEQHNDVSDILISTGGYQPSINELMLFISNRHIKDILRSYCHEIVHHNQTLDNGDYIRRIYANDMIVDNPELEEIEAEAYLKGNLLFRKFTEDLKKKLKKSNKK